MTNAVSNIDDRLNPRENRVWELVSTAPLPSLWCVPGVRVRSLVARACKSAMENRLFGHAAELGFYFLLSLFPALFCASSILGLAARSASQIYDRLLHYLTLVIPHSAFGILLTTFDQTTAASSSRKVTLGLLAAIWSASVGISAVQDSLNSMYRLQETRSYLRARLAAIGLTLVLIVTMSLCLSCLFAGDFLAYRTQASIPMKMLSGILAGTVRTVAWCLAAGFLALSFALTYYWAPNVRVRRWYWLTPGAAVGMAGWLLASLGFRLYLYYFNNYSVTYGSLGAVTILLMWFYITGLMLLVGAQLNSEIEASAARLRVEQEPAVAPLAPQAPGSRVA